MRHGDKVNNLGRTTAHRKALLNNLAAQLIQHKRITTTLAKAKALRVFVEPLITRSKNDTTHNRRIVFSHLQNKESIKELFSAVSEKVADRPGGYTRIIKLAPRLGDAAEMAMIELVDFNTTYNVGEKAAAKKTRRSRGTVKKETPAAAATTEEATTPAVEEAPKADSETTNEVTKPEGAE
ncbi:MAG: 50S ribosomal protein L17 [Chryseobacterium sp.]|nr:MAG: 50S ribosomal protein L17 [Chryseobacterium sp.]